MINWIEMSSRERDILVAEKIMGEPQPDGVPIEMARISLQTFFESTGHKAWQAESIDGEWVWAPLPFTTKIGPAWKVVEKLVSEDLSVNVTAYWGGTAWANVMDNVESIGHTSADTVPEAICIVALRAKGVDV